jgi:flagellar basal body-associated protein FliL
MSGAVFAIAAILIGALVVLLLLGSAVAVYRAARRATATEAEPEPAAERAVPGGTTPVPPTGPEIITGSGIGFPPPD